MSNLRYDPVHDISNSLATETAAAVATAVATTDASPQKIATSADESSQRSDKVSISSLLSQSNNNAEEAVTEQMVENDSKTALSKRMALSQKRKLKENHHLPAETKTPTTPVSKKRRRDVKDVKEPDTNPIHRTRHLKKPDSEPLWRLDIQHDFLQHLLTNTDKFFRNPFDPIDEDIKYWSKIGDRESSLGYNGKLTFFQLYLLSILKSSRISKILKDRLLTDLNYAFKFIILCLLVNFGRLNTTINFDYEMRSQLRTYHCIPVLQIHHDIFGIASEPEDVIENNGGGSGYTMNSVKQLQDTPRLKTILKSVSDFNNALNNDTFDVFINTCKDTNMIDRDNLSLKFNLVSLIFSLSQYEDQIMEQYVKGRRYENDKKSTVFNEIFNLNNVTPENKVKRFLWLAYFFAETDMSKEQNLSNPYGEIVDGENLIPNIELGDANVYNQDTTEEMKFAEEMKSKRKNFLEIVENLPESESGANLTKDGRLKLNKKGRKKRVINDGPITTIPTTKVVTKRPPPPPPPVVPKIKKDTDPIESLKQKVMNKFLQEYINLKIGNFCDKRQRMGNLAYFTKYGEDIEDLNEFKLSYYKLLKQYQHISSTDDLKMLINDLF